MLNNIVLTLADCLTASELQPKNRLRTKNLPVDRQAEKVHTSRGPSNHLHVVGNVPVSVSEIQPLIVLDAGAAETR